MIGAMIVREPSQSPPDVVFDAVLEPHASLAPRGFLALMAAISLISFAAGAAFIAIGAWPVFGFFGLDALLLYFAFRLSYRRARRYETLRLTETALTVERVKPDGARESFDFQPYWLRVVMDDPPRHDSALVLTSHGRSLIVGSFLAPAERLEVARALNAALDRVKGVAI